MKVGVVQCRIPHQANYSMIATSKPTKLNQHKFRHLLIQQKFLKQKDVSRFMKEITQLEQPHKNLIIRISSLNNKLIELSIIILQKFT